VTVTGGGAIGLVVVQLGQSLGARQVVVVEPNPVRRAMAERWGAVTFAPSEEVASWCRESAADRGGFDIGFECSAAYGHSS
jgi:threonine 3-dehydrogenase